MFTIANMSPVERTQARSPRRQLLREVAPVAAALAVVAASLGAIAVSKGVELWLITLMGALVFAGGSEFLVVGLACGGAAPLTAVLAGLMLNARHLPFGFAVGDLLRGWWQRLLGSHLMVDESVAFALARNDPQRRREAYWAVGLVLYLTWAPSIFVGGLLAHHVGDPAALGLDAAFPAALLALIAPALRDRPTARAVALGSVLALITTPVLPEGLPVLLALLGVAAALPVPRRQAQEPAR